MNVKSRLRHLAEASKMGRRIGKTTGIATVCKAMDGLMLGANHSHAKMLEHEYGVNARSMKMDLHGFSGPFFFDHYALECLLEQAADKIESLEEELVEAKRSKVEFP